MIKLLIRIGISKNPCRNFFSRPEYIGFVLYFSAVSYFSQQVVQVAKKKLSWNSHSDSSEVVLPLGVEVSSTNFFFSAATACSPRAFSTQRWLAGLMCELSLTSRSLFKRTKFTKPARSAGQGRTDYPSLTCLGSLRERQRS